MFPDGKVNVGIETHRLHIKHAFATYLRCGPGDTGPGGSSQELKYILGVFHTYREILVAGACASSVLQYKLKAIQASRESIWQP